MNTYACAVIDHLGGTTALAKLVKTPTSTVHSWRVNGIPPWRMTHIRMIAAANGKTLPTPNESAQP